MQSLLLPMGSAVLATAITQRIGSAFPAEAGGGKFTASNVVIGVGAGVATGAITTPLFTSIMGSLEGGLCMSTGFALWAFTSAVMTDDCLTTFSVNAVASLILFGVYNKCMDLPK